MSTALTTPTGHAGLQPRADADKAQQHGPVDAVAVRAAYESTEYAAGHRDGLMTGCEIGERKGTLYGFWWGAGTGAFAVMLLALIAGFVMASWGDADTIAPAPVSSKAPATSTPAAPRTAAPHWSAGT